MDLNETEAHAAAAIAAALIVANHPKIKGAMKGGSRFTPEALAAEVYHDCLEAIRVERAKRHQVQAGS